jgi:hypothetical protein
MGGFAPHLSNLYTIPLYNQRSIDRKAFANMKNYIGIGVAIGAGVGAAIGVALNSIAIGVAVGIAVGVALGYALNPHRKGKK